LPDEGAGGAVWTASTFTRSYICHQVDNSSKNLERLFVQRTFDYCFFFLDDFEHPLRWIPFDGIKKFFE